MVELQTKAPVKSTVTYLLNFGPVYALERLPFGQLFVDGLRDGHSAGEDNAMIGEVLLTTPKAQDPLWWDVLLRVFPGVVPGTPSCRSKAKNSSLDTPASSRALPIPRIPLEYSVTARMRLCSAGGMDDGFRIVDLADNVAHSVSRTSGAESRVAWQSYATASDNLHALQAACDEAHGRYRLASIASYGLRVARSLAVPAEFYLPGQKPPPPPPSRPSSWWPVALVVSFRAQSVSMDATANTASIKLT